MAAGLLSTAAPAASETASPTWVAEGALEFKAFGDTSSNSTLDPDEAAELVQAQKAAHQASISTPAAEAERQQSIDAFTDLGAFAAAGLAIEVFEDQLQDLTTLATEPLLESETPPVFLSDTSARINPPGQEDSSLLVSSIPLRNQQGELVSGEIVAEPGGFAPLSPLSEVEFPQTSSGEVNFPSAEISFEFEDAASTQGRLVSAGDAPGKEMVFYPNTAPDTDIAVTYILGGIESFNFLRSEDSPENLTLNYTLPDGTTLAGTPDGGAAALSQNGQTLLTVYPPYAVDAQGSFVPMSLTVEGDSILLSVPHRGEDFAYPIMVDPVQHIRNWWVDGASAGYEGWSFHQTGTSNYASSNTCPAAVLPLDPCGGTGAGLYTSGVPGRYYPANSKGYWRWSVPGGGTSSIQSATLSSWRYRKGAATANNNPFAFFELTPGGSRTITTAGSGGSSLALTGSAGSTKFLQVGLTSDSNMTLPAGSTNWRYNRVGAFTANLTDAEPPELTLGQAPSGWLGPNTPFTVPATARDAGLGMGSIQAYIGSNWTSKWLGWCWGTYPYPCPNGPFNTSLSFNSNSFPSGINTVPVKAVDVVGGTGHETSRDATVRVDKTGPTISSVGGLTKPDQAGYQMTLQVTDNTLAGPTYDTNGELTNSVPQASYDKLQSGAKRVRVYVNGVLDAEQQRSCQGTLGSCRIGAIGYTMPAANYSEGTHEIKVEATDMVGNTATSTWNKLVDKTAPTVPTITRNPSTGPITNDQLDLTVSTSDAGYGVGKFVARVGGLLQSFDFDCSNGCSGNGSHTFSFNVSDLPEGTPVVEVTVSDQAGNSRTTDLGTVEIDRDSAEVYEIETTKWANDSLELDVAAANLGAGINQLRLERNDTQAVIGSKSLDCSNGCPTYVDEAISADVSALAVGAHALDLKVSAPGGADVAEAISLNIDRSPPDIDQIDGPLLDSSTSVPVGINSTVHVEGTDGGSGLNRMEVSIGETLVATELVSELDSEAGEQTCSAGECTFEFDIPVSLFLEAETGPQDIEVAIVDAAGNRSEVGSEVLLDATAPAITLGGALASRHGQNVDENETLGLTIDADDGGSSTNEAGVETVSVFVDGDPVTLGSAGPDCTDGCPATWTTATPFEYDASEFGPGPHTILVETTDAVGNVDSSEIQISPDPSTLPNVEPACPTGSPDPITNANAGSVAGAISTLSPNAPTVIDPTVPYTVSGVGEVEPHLEGDVNDDTLDITETPFGGSVSTDPAGDMILNHGMCLSQSAVSDDNSEVAVVGDHSVVVADSTPNADTFVRPNELGLTIVTQLRNPNGASALSWDIGVAQDQALEETPTGGVALVTEGDPMPPIATDLSRPTMNEVLAGVNEVADQQVSAAYELTKASASVDGKLAAVLGEPRAIDVNGNEIPVELSINGTDRVSIAIPSNAAYPVTVVMSGFTAPDPASFCLEVNRDDPGRYWSECHASVEEPTIEDSVHPAEIVDIIDAMLGDDAGDEPEVTAALQALRVEYRADALTRAAVGNPLVTYDTNWAEVSYCLKPFRQWTCKLFQGDSKQASSWTRDNFTNYTESNRVDATWGNAFLHALWVALMSKSKNVKDALDFGLAHEAPDIGSSNRKTRLRSVMDVWNNRKGANFYTRWGQDNNEHGVCSIIYHQSEFAKVIGLRNARRTGPSNVLKYLWVRGKLGGPNGIPVRRRGSNRC